MITGSICRIALVTDQEDFSLLRQEHPQQRAECSLVCGMRVGRGSGLARGGGRGASLGSSLYSEVSSV